MEWIIGVIPVLVGLCGAGVSLFYNYQNRKSSTPEPVKNTLSASDRSDVYQDMAWWDREFRKLCGEPEPARQLSDSLNQAIGALQRFGLIGLTPMVEEIKPGGNITYLYDVLTEKEYQAEMKKALND